MKAVMQVVLAALAAVPLCGTAAAGPLPFGAGGIRLEGNVRSLQEIRQEKVIRQKWDLSCGAAALSTVLTYHFGDDTPESAIIVSLLKKVDPKVVRARGGFSLKDLKGYAEARGYGAKGYAELTLDDLTEFKTPIIIPVNIKGYDHFVVFRGLSGDRALLSDPVFGSVTMRKDRFLEVWKNKIGFLLTKDGFSKTEGGLLPGPEDFLVPDESVIKAISSIRPAPATRHGP